MQLGSCGLRDFCLCLYFLYFCECDGNNSGFEELLGKALRDFGRCVKTSS